MRMGKDKGVRLRLTLGGSPLAEIFSRTTPRGETIIKPLGQPSIHLSVYSPEKDELGRHIKDEAVENDQYTHRTVFGPEKLILRFLAALAPEDNPPPNVRSFADPEDARRVGEWLGRVWPTITRKAEDRQIRILRGPMMDLAKLVDRVRRGEPLGTLTVDLAPILDSLSGIDGAEEAFSAATERDLRRGDSRLVLSQDSKKLILCVEDGVILEMDPDRLLAAVAEMSDLLGPIDLLNAIRQKGYEFVDERGMKALQEWGQKRP